MTGHEAIGQIFHPPAWALGGISIADAAFLLDCLEAHEPRAVLELGVAAGLSSAALLFGLDRLVPIPGGRVLYSVDVADRCYFAPEVPVGAAVGALYPHHVTPWRLQTGVDAARARRMVPPIDFVFIDANHAHPWPLLDLLHMATVTRPLAWIGLHDIDLARVMPNEPHYGAEWLYEAWPFGKVRGAAGAENIGAVQLPRSLRELVPLARDLFARPFEETPRPSAINLPEFPELVRLLRENMRPLHARP